MQHEVDGILREILHSYDDGAIEEGDLSAFSLVFEQFHHAVADRHVVLERADATWCRCGADNSAADDNAAWRRPRRPMPYRLRRDVGAPHRLQRRQRQNAGQRIHRDDDGKHRQPAAGLLAQQRRERTAEDRADALRDVKQSVIRGGVLGAEGVGQGRGKQRKDFAPAEEHQAGQDHEHQCIVAEHHHQRHRRGFHQERDRHGVLAPDPVRDHSRRTDASAHWSGDRW